jgi:hypothetical protein
MGLGVEDEATLGHMSDTSLEEIWFGPHYEALREMHRTGNYPDYCRLCDFLVNDPDALAWTNAGRTIDHMVGTEFRLDEYRAVDG